MDILSGFNDEELYIVNSIERICRIKDIKSYVVGGAVRDILLHVNVKDIDICLNEDPIVVLKSLGGVHKFKYYDEFQTASIIFNNGISIDLIRCRKEVYLKPGMLPKIIPSDIKDDLYRRDFTVNALAYDLSDHKLIDPYGGSSDIEKKLIKKVHKNSYMEDPTRIFRAIKYSIRYGFYLYDVNEIMNCICNKALQSISTDRLVREIYLLCKEENWKNAYLLFEKFHIFKLNCGLIGKINLNTDYNDINIRVLNLYYSLRDKKQGNILTYNSILDTRVKKALIYIRENYHSIKSIEDNILDNYEIFKVFQGIHSYVLIYLSWNFKLAYKIYNYMYNLQSCKLRLNGNKVKSLGVKNGKCIGIILKHSMKIRLNTGIEKELDPEEIKNALKYKDRKF